VKAILLAAGFGTRLKPITDKIPKCLVSLAGKPLMEYWLDKLEKIGVTEVLINTHYLESVVIDYIKTSKYSRFVKIVSEKKILGTAGTLLKNLDFYGKDDGILIHGDNISDDNFEGFLETFKKRVTSSVLTMLSFRSDFPESCGIIEVNQEGIVIDYEEKPKNAKSNLANGAVFIMSRQCINEIKFLKDVGEDFCKDIVPRFVGRMNAYETKNFFIDIGTITSYSKANAFFNNKSNTKDNNGEFIV